MKAKLEKKLERIRDLTTRAMNIVCELREAAFDDIKKAETIDERADAMRNMHTVMGIEELLSFAKGWTVLVELEDEEPR